MGDNAKKPAAVLIGYKGVKYGLQKKKLPNAPKLDAFGDGSSEDEAVDVQLAKQQRRNLTATKVAAAQAAAIAEDSTVYQYDSLYDDMQRSREQPKQKELQERKPKYIEALMQKAEIRKKEQDIAYERRLLKERKQDDHLFEDKEAFLTSAYKKKLVEDKYWIEREKRMDAVEEAEDVTKKSDLTGFYQKLCTKNVAFASNRLVPSAVLDEAKTQVQAESDTATDIDLSKPRAHVSEPVQASEQTMSPSRDSKPEAMPVPAESQSVEDKPPTEATSTMPVEEPVKDSRKRRNDESSISSARERYLARKHATNAERS